MEEEKKWEEKGRRERGKREGGRERSNNIVLPLITSHATKACAITSK